MHDKLMQMLKGKRDLSDNERMARMDVVKHLRDDASQEMAGRLDGLKKVSVMSDSQQGLEKGLDKAKEIVSSKEMNDMKNHAENPYGDYKSALEEHSRDENNQEEGWKDNPNQYSEGGEVEESPEHEASESSEEEMAEHQDEEEPEMSEDEIDQKLAQLMAMKQKMEAKKS